MTNKPQTNNHTGNCSGEVHGTFDLTVSLLGKTPEASKSEEKDKGNNPRTRREYILWPVIALFRLAAWGFAWLDNHDGAIVAMATVVIAWLTIAYSSYAEKQWQVAQETLSVSQRAYVTIGRQDGIVADFDIPKDPKQDAEVVIYFQNNGHVPAKFKWGTTIDLLGIGSTKHSGIKMTHAFAGIPPRIRDKQYKSISQQGEISTIPSGSVFIATLGTITQKDLADLPANDPSLVILGTYEYCDELGTHLKRNFVLRYRNSAPISSRSFDLATEFAVPVSPLPRETDTQEYLPPCETLAEHEQARNPKNTFSERIKSIFR